MSSMVQDGWYQFDNDINSLIMALNGCYVVSGMTVTEQSPLAMGVTVAAGTYYANGTKVVKGSSTNIALDASDPYKPRKELIVGDSAGTLSFVKGTAAYAQPSTETGPKTYQPKPPDIPSGKTLLAEVWVGAGVNSIVNADITDRRIILDYIDHAELVGVTADQHHAQLHKTAHEDGGADEVSVAGLSGVLADRQLPNLDAIHAGDTKFSGQTINQGATYTSPDLRDGTQVPADAVGVFISISGIGSAAGSYLTGCSADYTPNYTDNRLETPVAGGQHTELFMMKLGTGANAGKITLKAMSGNFTSVAGWIIGWWR